MPNIGAGCCLEPEVNGVSLGEGGEGLPGPQKAGKISSARKEATWRSKKKEKRVRHDEEGPARTK